MCLKVYCFSYNNSILYNFFINDPHLTKYDPMVIQKNFGNKKGAHTFSKYNKEKIIRIHHWSPEKFKFL